MYEISDFCTDPNILKAIKFIMTLIQIASYIVPLIVIGFATFDLTKAIINGNYKDSSKFLKSIGYRVVAGILVFFIPTFIELLISIVEKPVKDSNFNYNSCMTNIDNIEYFQELFNIKKAKYNEDLKSQEAKRKAEEKAKKEEQLKIMKAAQQKATQEGDSTVVTENPDSTPNKLGQRYQFTDKQIRSIAYVCQREQGTVVGAKAEASLIANRFELYGKKFGTGGTGLYNYVRTSGWFGTASAMDNPQGLKPEILSAVKEVLEQGKRTLPFYVDEHDCIDCGRHGYDVTKIITDGKTITDKSQLKNHNNYKSENTIIYNRYGSVYTFVTFPMPNSDPFGYTATAKRKYDAMNKGA